MNKNKLTTAALGLALLATTAGALLGWYHEHRHVAELESRVAQLQQEEQRSAVVRSISRQMEELAFQQRDISEEQREQALEQKQVAETMRQRSEIERQHAIEAQGQAIASEKRAQEARVIAIAERQTAEEQRTRAEDAKRVADTLSFRALARSLASQATTQAQVGNTDLARLLAYAAYDFTRRYRGDVYSPAVFQALMMASESKNVWTRNRGMVTSVNGIGETGLIATASSYGELMIHHPKGEQLDSRTIVSNSLYDFRDQYVDSHNTIYAVSRSGHLVVVEGNTETAVELDASDHPRWVTELNQDSLIVVGDHVMTVIDKRTKAAVTTRHFGSKISCVSRYDYKPVIFDQSGQQHLVSSATDIVTGRIPVNGLVTAFASSKTALKKVYGMDDGTIYLVDRNGKTTKLQGHLSHISMLKLNNTRLFSASYDRTLKFWNINSERIEPMTLLTAQSWIMDFTFDPHKDHVWLGDQQGNVIEAIMSAPAMADIVQQKLSREFSADEWKYYMGGNIPYETFRQKQGKERRP